MLEIGQTRTDEHVEISCAEILDHRDSVFCRIGVVAVDDDEDVGIDDVGHVAKHVALALAR